jgi:hypothetical protein
LEKGKISGYNERKKQEKQKEVRNRQSGKEALFLPKEKF